jgi:hypothetical protein
MKHLRSVGLVALVFLLSGVGDAEQAAAARQSSAVVPPWVNFSGVLTDATGKPLTGTQGITFCLYKDAQGGTPLWMETQNVQLDKTGHYKVMLGSTSSQGLPADIFAWGEARWLGVQAQGQEEQSRVMLLAVPYALKAADAETVGGKPASAFMPATAIGNSNAAGSFAPRLSGSGKANYVARWLSSTKLGDSNIFETSSGQVGIGTTTPNANLDVKGSGDIRGALTLFPSGSSPTFAVSGTSFSVSSSGLVNFVSGQSFPGTGTISGVTAGSGLSGGGTSGNVTLTVPNGGIANPMLQNPWLTVNPGGGMAGGGKVSLGGAITLGLENCGANQILEFIGAWTCATAGTGTITGVTAGTDLTGGGTSSNVTLNLDTTRVPQLSASNTFTGNQSINGNLSVAGLGGGNLFVTGSVTGQAGTFSTALFQFADVVGNGQDAYIGDPGCGQGFAGIGFGNLSGCNNYSMIGDGANTYINRPTGGTLFFREGNGNEMTIAAGGQVGVGTSSPNAKLDVRGGAGNSGFGIAADSNAWQDRGASGWVKAMAYVDPFPCSNCAIAITRCYSSQQTGTATTTPPCGLTINHTAQGTNIIDFGFQVTDRFIQLQTQITPASLNFNGSATPSAVVSFSNSPSQLAIFTFDPQANTGQVSNPVDVPFYVFVF